MCVCVWFMYVCMYVCMYVFYIFEYILAGFDLLHTYSSDALAQGILKSFFAFTKFVMPLPVLCTCVYMYVCTYVCIKLHMCISMYMQLNVYVDVYLNVCMYVCMYV